MAVAVTACNTTGIRPERRDTDPVAVEGAASSRQHRSSFVPDRGEGDLAGLHHRAGALAVLRRPVVGGQPGLVEDRVVPRLGHLVRTELADRPWPPRRAAAASGRRRTIRPPRTRPPPTGPGGHARGETGSVRRTTGSPRPPPRTRASPGPRGRAPSCPARRSRPRRGAAIRPSDSLSTGCQPGSASRSACASSSRRCKEGLGGTGLPETMSAVAISTTLPSSRRTVTIPPSHDSQIPSTSVIAGPPDGPVSPASTRRTTTRRPTTCGPRLRPARVGPCRTSGGSSVATGGY